MFLLAVNVLDPRIKLTTADRKRAIPALPGEPGIPRIDLLYPSGRVLLDLLQQIGLRESRPMVARYAWRRGRRFPSIDGSRFFVLNMMWMMTWLNDCGMKTMNRAFSARVWFAAFPGRCPRLV